jgi:hypothetical protein
MTYIRIIIVYLVTSWNNWIGRIQPDLALDPAGSGSMPDPKNSDPAGSGSHRILEFHRISGRIRIQIRCTSSADTRRYGGGMKKCVQK